MECAWCAPGREGAGCQHSSLGGPKVVPSGVRSKQKLRHGRPWIWDFISSPLRSHWSAGFGHISRAFVGISAASPCGVECGCSQKQRDLRATGCLSREGWTAVAEVKKVTGEKRLVI